MKKVLLALLGALLIIGGFLFASSMSANATGNHKKVTICHVPPGNPSNAHTIEISYSALPAHILHGDKVGACKPKPVEPTPTPTVPTEEPTSEPTTAPTTEPTEEPSEEPTSEPTTDPTTEPTEEPTTDPTTEPTEEPTDEPTTDPTTTPTEEPTTTPTETPSEEPTDEPTVPATDSPLEPEIPVVNSPVDENTAIGTPVQLEKRYVVEKVSAEPKKGQLANTGTGVNAALLWIASSAIFGGLWMTIGYFFKKRRPQIHA